MHDNESSPIVTADSRETSPLTGSTPIVGQYALDRAASRRQMLATAAFVLALMQLVLLTRSMWMPWFAGTSFGHSLFWKTRLPVPEATPLKLHVKEITRHPTKANYWNLKIDAKNRTEAWVNYPYLVLSFLDDKKKVVYRNTWAPKYYLSATSSGLLSPHEEVSLSLWLQLPENLPSEYNLDYFYPR